MRFGLGIAMSAFSHSPFGWAGWALNWLTNSVLFHQSNYISHSTSVARWASPRGGPPLRGTMPRPQDSYNRAPGNYDRSYAAGRPYEPPSRAYAGNSVRPALPAHAYNRPQPVMPARPQPYARPGGYGSNFNGTQPYAARPATPYATPQQSWRAPSPAPQRNDLAQRSYLADRSYPVQRSYQTAGNRGYAESYARGEKSGGFHLFGNHNAEKSYGGYQAPSYKAPKGFKAPKQHSHGGGGHSGGHLFGGGHRR